MTKFRAFELALLAIVPAVLLAACSPSEPPPTTATGPNFDRSQPPIGQLSGNVVPQRYRLELTIDPSQDRFSGTASIDLNIGQAADGVWLHGKNLDVSEIYLVDANGNRMDGSYEQKLDSGVALVSFEQAFESGAATLNFKYSAPFNSSTNALFNVERDGLHYAATQFQPIAARQVFPGFDEPGFKVPFDLTLITRADDVAITTTPEVSAEALPDGFLKRVFETTRPLPTYLLAFAVGPYDVVDNGAIPANTIRDREVALRAIAAKGRGERLDYALKNTDGLLTVLEEYFGTPYPYRKLDLIAMPESFGGAMENVGAITYDEFLLLMDEESPLSQRRSYTAVHAHELAHMWFGNLVTPSWWNDIWLNESFATWMMYKASDAYWPDGEFDRETLKGALGAMANDSLAAAREIREPIDDNAKIGGAFDGITYQKGGGVLSMLERYVGEERFQAGIRLHMDRHQDGTATAEDFIASVAEGSERLEIEGAFKSFIEQAGVPLLSAELDCEDPANPSLTVTQSRYAPLGSPIDTESNEWQIPMCFNFTAGGESNSSCTLLNERVQTITLDADSCPSFVHPNADGAGYYRFSLDDAAWTTLIDESAELPATEALVMADSLDAAFRAGMVNAESYVSGMAALAHHSAWDVADSATGYLEQIGNVIDPGNLGPVERAFRDIAHPRYAQLADATDSGSQLLRQRMQRFLIVIAKDEEMRAPLAEQASAIIGLDGDADPSAAPASQWETIFSIGVQDIGAPFFELLLEQAIASDDPTFRSAATGALARVEDPVLVRRLQAALLEDHFKGTEFTGILFRQMIRAATTELTYSFIRDNLETVVPMIPESFRSSVVPALGGSFCTVDRATEWEQLVVSIADSIPGYERDLAQATESIRLCAALREASESELVAAFADYR